MSGSGETWIPTRCGDGKLSGDVGAAEYPCVRRYRHRRLLTFLWLQGFQATHGSMVSESDAIMWVPHLKELVLDDHWQDANRYLARFFMAPDTRRPTSVEAMVLLRVFNLFHTLAVLVGGKQDSHSKQYLDHKRTVGRGHLRLRSIMLNVQLARASIDWERVKEKAAEMVDELAYATPELQDMIFMPRGPLKPHNVLPIGFGVRWKCRPKKQIRKPKSPAGVAKSYLKRWRRVPASSDPSQETYDHNLTLAKALDRMADIADECLKAGKLEHPLQTTETKGTTADPVLQTVSSSLTCPAIYTGIPSVANAGAIVSPVSRNVFVTPGMPLANAGKSASHALTPASHALTPGAPISSTAVGCFTGPDKSSELPLMTNAVDSIRNNIGHLGLNLRKNLREETTSDDEQDLHLKRQRTTGAFGHAGLMPAAAIET